MVITQKTKNKLPFLGAIFALLPSLWIEFTAGNFVLAIVFMCILILNVLALRLKTGSLYAVNIALYGLNAIAMIMIAYQFMEGGKTYLHYPYFLACAGFILAGIVYTLRYKKAKLGV